MNLEDIVYEEASPEICERMAQAFPEGKFEKIEFVFFRDHKTIMRGKAIRGDAERYFVATVSPEEISNTWIKKAMRKIRMRFRK